MDKVIEIDGKAVKFRATAAIPRLYRIKFGRDIIQDMKAVHDAMKKAERGEAPIPAQMLEVFENVFILWQNMQIQIWKQKVSRSG